jgi:hypothetical protein
VARRFAIAGIVFFSRNLLTRVFAFDLFRLLSLGYSMEDIATAALDSQQARQDRAASMESKKWDKFQEIAESAVRKLKKIAGKTKPPLESKKTVAGRSA